MSTPPRQAPASSQPLLSWRTRASLTLWGAGLWAVLAWHLSLAAVSDVVQVQDLAVTVQYLAHGHPLGEASKGSGTGAGLALAAAMFLAPVLLIWLARAFWGNRGGAHAGVDGFASRAQVRSQLGTGALQQGAGELRPGLQPTTRRPRLNTKGNR